ncbi:MAG: acetyl-CoA carboxylase biotin carboxyl carrier protein subunit [Gemmatimonadota bacterium]
MTSGRHWVVIPAGGGGPYAVTLQETAAGWAATVTRDGATWRFALAPGPEPGRVWSDAEPLSVAWTPGRLTLHGLSHPLTVETATAYRLRDVARAHRPAAAVGVVTAPMPGLVLAIHIRAGDVVTSGHPLLIIEAMKMENEVTAHTAGIIGEVFVTPGQALSAGAALCRIDPAPGDGA